MARRDNLLAGAGQFGLEETRAGLIIDEMKERSLPAIGAPKCASMAARQASARSSSLPSSIRVLSTSPALLRDKSAW
jgi:hypothetical protein